MPLRSALKCLPLSLAMMLVLVGTAAAQTEPTGRVDVTITLKGEGSWTDENGDDTAVRIDRRLQASIALQGARSSSNPIDARRVPGIGEQMPSAEQQMALAREAQACGQNLACLQKLATRIAAQQPRAAAAASRRGAYYSVWSSHPFDSSGCVLSWNERVDDTLRRSWRPAGEPRTETTMVRASNPTPSALLPATQTPPVCSSLSLLVVESGTGAWTFAPAVLLSSAVRAEITERGVEARTRTEFVPLLDPETGTSEGRLLERNPHLAGTDLPGLVFRGMGPLQGDTTIGVLLGRPPEALHLQLTVSWRARLEKDEDVRVAIEGPACGCMNAEDAESKPLRFTATASKPGGTFTRFAVRPVGAAPREIVNQGGSTARLELAAARGTEAVTLAITYQKDGKQHQAEHRLELCAMDSIRFAGGYRDHTFDDSKPGRLEVRASAAAWHNGQEISPELTWRLEAMGSGTALDPGDATGASVVLAYVGLPKLNSAFGEKTVTARVEKGACACEREARIRTFFPLAAVNHPPGDGGTGADMTRAPNWYYYWMQTGARQGWGPSSFRHVPVIPAENPGDLVLARVLQDDELILLSDLIAAAGQPCTRRSAGTGGAQPNAAGIDCFAEVIRHEGRHLEEYRLWWKGNWDRATIDDPDMDLIPNAVEAQEPGCSRFEKFSCTNRPFPTVPDTELFAYYEGWRWPLGSADKEDWSCGGKQWKGGACPK